MLTRVVTLAQGRPLECLVFYSRAGQWLALMTDAALTVRRDLASTLTPEKLDALRAKPDPTQPQWEQMQELYDAGMHQVR